MPRFAASEFRQRVPVELTKLDQFRHIATRCDRRAIRFLACLDLASAIIRDAVNVESAWNLVSGVSPNDP